MATTTTLHRHHISPLQSHRFHPQSHLFLPRISHPMRKPNKGIQLLIHCYPQIPRPICRGHVLSVVRSGAVGREMEGVGAPTSVPVRVAVELIQAGHRYLDVRTPEEFSAGHVPGAVNVPYLLKFGSGMMKNNSFLEDVASAFGKNDEIVVGCQSGKRSLMAATVLLSAGYTNITDIAGGYAAWLENGLPTE